MNKLRKKGIITQADYMSIIFQFFYNSLGHNNKQFPDANSFNSQILNLPLFVDLKEEVQFFFIGVFRSFQE